MKKSIWIFAILVLCAFPAISMGEVTGEQFLLLCAPLEKLDKDPTSLTSKEATGIVYCLGYIESFMDTFSFQKAARIVPGIPYCLPEEKISKKKFAQIVVDFMKNNAEQLEKPAIYSIFMGIRGAFPCAEENTLGDAEAVPQNPDKVIIQSGPPVSRQPGSK